MNQPIISKGWLTVALIAIGLFLVWLVFRGCGPDNKHKENKSEVDSIRTSAQARHRHDSLVIVQYKDAITLLNKDKGVLKEKVQALETQLNKSSGKANKIAYEVVKAKIIHDTVNYIAGCDSLVTAVADLTNILDNYQYEMGEMVNNYEAQLTYKDSVISIQTVGRAELMKSFNEVTYKYDVLYVDYSKVIKKGKRERLLTRVLAGATLVLGGIVLAR